MIEQILRCLWRPMLLEICRARDELMSIRKDSTRHQTRIFECAEPEHQIDPFDYVIDPTVSDENLDPNIRIGCLERVYQGYQ